MSIDDKIKELLATLDDIARNVDYDFDLPLGGDSEDELIKATKEWLDSLHGSASP